MSVLNEYLKWHTLRVFFEGFYKWTDFCEVYKLELKAEPNEYEAFLFGCDADICIPLWASVCIDETASLLNKTTHDIIRHYKKLGYSPIDMDGNPSDYIGQLCRYLEYISSCMLKEPDNTFLQNEYTQFKESYYLPTAQTIVHRSEQYRFSLALTSVISLLTGDLPDDIVKNLTDFYKGFDSYSWHINPPIADGETHFTSNTSFGDCGRKCKALSEVSEGCILSVRPDTGYKEKQFALCPRGAQYRQTFLSPLRLRYPMKRIGRRGEGKFKRISWEEAEKYIAAEILRTSESGLPETRYILPGSGVSALMRGDKFLRDLLSLTGGFLSFYNYYSCACAETALPYVFGTDQCGSSYQEMQKTKLLILWGHNPENTLWGDEFLPNLRKAKESGVRIIVIDPRRSETAVKYADQWIGIRPSSDGALADAIAYEIWSRKLQDQEFMDKFCIGFDEEHMPDGAPAGESYHSYLFGEKDGIIKNAGWASGITGIPEDVIIRLSIEYATTKPAALMPGLGPQRTLNGEQNCRSIAMLACLTGNVGRAGGWSGGYPNKGGCDGPSYKLRENPYKGKIPSFMWTKAAADWENMNAKDGLKGVSGLRSGIKLMFSIASGMLMTQHSNVNETAQILSLKDHIETLVVSDIFMTPAARYADILLPGVSFFEVDNFVPSWNSSNYFLFNQKAVEPLFEARFEVDWVCSIAKILGLENEIRQDRNQRQWLSFLYDELKEREPEIPEFEDFAKAGCYVFPSDYYQIAFSEQINEDAAFNTPSGKIEIFSERLYNSGELPGIPSYTPCEEGPEDARSGNYPLQLIGFHTLRRCHSIHDSNRNLDRFERQELWINPADAEKRNIKNNDLVEIYNNRGRVRIPAYITDRIVPGAVAFSEGGWFTPDKDGTDIRGCLNTLTFSHRATPLAHANPQHTALVEVVRY